MTDENGLNSLYKNKANHIDDPVDHIPLDIFSKIKNVKVSNGNNVITSEINIKFSLKKFYQHKEIVLNNVDILERTDTILDDTFRTSRLMMNNFSKSFTLDRIKFK